MTDVRTLTDLYRSVLEHDKPDCLLVKESGSYRAVSARDFGARVGALAKTLESWGIQPGDRVALMAENGPHWPLVDFATLCLAAVDVPVYATLHPEGAAYVIRDSGSRIVFVQGRERLEGLLARRAEMPSVERIVVIDEPSQDGVLDLEQAIANGAGVTPAEIDAWLARARPDDLATLIYTSGTTGDPKGVMLTHRNLVSNVVTCARILPLRTGWTALSFLPLAHSLERTVAYCYFYCGISIAYAESVKTVSQNMSEVRPHVFASVPRVYEKIREAVLEKAEASHGLRRAIFDWAMRTGRRSLPKRIAFEDPGLATRLADRLVFSKIRDRLGGRFEYAISGGAPLGKELAEFFWSAGIPLLEGYGLTETSPVLAVNSPTALRLGTVGKPIPGVEIEIAADGEILARGPNIMKGYFNHPEATAEVIDAAGWFHTGDIGALDEDGYLSITDRKKELIVNAYGKNIAPAPIENSLKSGRFIAQAVVVGDRRPFLVALLIPNFEALRSFAQTRGLGDDHRTWLRDPRVREVFQHEVDRVNANHERYEQVHAFELLPDELTQEDGSLTPTLKVKRRIVHERFHDLLDRLYSETEAARNSG